MQAWLGNRGGRVKSHCYAKKYRKMCLRDVIGVR